MAPLVYCLVLLSASFLSLRNKVENYSSFVPSDVLRVQYFQLKFPIGIILGNLEFNLEFYLHKMKRQSQIPSFCPKTLVQHSDKGLVSLFMTDSYFPVLSSGYCYQSIVKRTANRNCGILISPS